MTRIKQRPDFHTSDLFVQHDREAWAAVGDTKEMAQADTEAAIYRRLIDFLTMRRHAEAVRRSAEAAFLSIPEWPPYIIGIAGGVAAGKSRFAASLAAMMTQGPDAPDIEVVATDNFLRTNRDLEAHGLANRNGFPESFDRAALFMFLTALRAGRVPLDIPVYAHQLYDIDPLRTQRVTGAGIVLIEGLNILQPTGDGGSRFSDLIDLSIYLDADEALLHEWFIERFGQLLRTAFRDPSSHLHALSILPEKEAFARADQAWDEINLPNLREHIAPGRNTADVILRKGADHRIDAVLIRR